MSRENNSNNSQRKSDSASDASKHPEAIPSSAEMPKPEIQTPKASFKPRRGATKASASSSRRAEDSDAHDRTTWHVGFGLLLLLTAIAFAAWGFSKNELGFHQRQILVWILPLASGASAFCFTGGLSVKGKQLLKGAVVSATGGFGVWLLTVFFLFPETPSDTSASHRVVDTVKSNVTEEAIQSDSTAKPIFQPLTNWIRVAADARNAKSTAKGRPLPNGVLDARARFENWWFESPLSVKKTLIHSNIFMALWLNVRVYREEEAESLKKPSSFKWVDEAISFFEEVGDQFYLAEANVEKAAIYLEVSDLNHTNPEVFANIAKEGELIMKRASELSNDDQKSRATRIWSRFYYNLARPRSGNLTQDWDKNLLPVSYEKMLEAYRLDTNQMANVSQLARVTQKLAANPPQDTDKEWTIRLWKVQQLLKAKWSTESPKITEPQSRIASLNILAVLTMDAVLRALEEGDGAISESKRAALLDEMDNIALKSQRESLSLILATELEERYDFDIYYDLARMLTTRLQVAEVNGKRDPNGDFAAAIQNLEAARRGATDTQRQAGIESISKYPSFSRLDEARRRALANALGANL